MTETAKKYPTTGRHVGAHCRSEHHEPSPGHLITLHPGQTTCQLQHPYPATACHLSGIAPPCHGSLSVIDELIPSPGTTFMLSNNSLHASQHTALESAQGIDGIPAPLRASSTSKDRRPTIQHTERVPVTAVLDGGGLCPVVLAVSGGGLLG